MAIPVVVVGLGTRGRQWSGEVRGAPAFTLAAACDPSAEARERAVAEGIPRRIVFGGLRDACVAVTPRAAIIATPVNQHVTPCERALEAGLAVLVEKPFTLGVADARRLVELASARGQPLLVGHNHRYLRMFRATKAMLDSGVLGRVVFVSMSCYREGHPVVAGLTEIPGAALWETGIHHLDLLRWLLGDPVVGVTAATSTPHPAAGLRETTWSATLEFEGGPLVAWHLSWDSRGHGAFERGQQFIARFVGEQGTLHVLQRWLVLCLRGRWPRLVRRGPRRVTEEQHLLRQLAAAVTDGATPDVSGEDNLRTVALAEACARSAYEGRRIDPRSLLADA